MIIAVTLCACLVAPAPAPKERPDRLPGHYIAHWGDTKAPTWLHVDGRYECNWKGKAWTGTWRMEGQRIYIAESPIDSVRTVSHTLDLHKTPYGYSLHYSGSNLIRVRLERMGK